VIGNGAYMYADPLGNPKNDAQAMAKVLERLGFQVDLGVDLRRDAMEDMLYAFADRLEAADVALLYFAGHGLQLHGENYLVPIDAELRWQAHLKLRTFNLNDQVKFMSEVADVSLVFLDACRDNPFSHSLRAGAGARQNRSFGSTGLARMVAGKGTYIAFATDPDNVAVDSTGGPNSPFTEALLAHIEEPLPVGQMMIKVRNHVVASTNNQQQPWEQSSLLKEFSFTSKTKALSSSAEAPKRPIKTQKAEIRRSDRERERAPLPEQPKQHSPRRRVLGLGLAGVFLAVIAGAFTFAYAPIRCAFNSNDRCALTADLEKQKGVIQSSSDLRAVARASLAFPELAATATARMKDLVYDNVLELEAVKLRGATDPKIIDEIRGKYPPLAEAAETRLKFLAAEPNVIGFVNYAVINSNKISSAYFSIDGYSGRARFPKRNELIAALDDNSAVRKEPFHWDVKTNKISYGSAPSRNLARGDKLRVVGDPFISMDTSGYQFAILPVAEVEGTDTIAGTPYTPVLAPPVVWGYAWYGMVGDKINFENQSRPNSLYPSAGDNLMATKNDVAVRSGPRKWDYAKGEYVNPEAVGMITAKQVVTVAGDAVLSSDGQSIWFPVAFPAGK